MKKLLAVFATLFLTQFVWGQGVPRCWQADQPGKRIEDGQFLIVIPTSTLNASEVAEVLGILQYAEVFQTGVNTSPNLDRINVQVEGDVSHWTKTAAFPTVDKFKNYIVKSISPVLRVPQVQVTCIPNNKRFHHLWPAG